MLLLPDAPPPILAIGAPPPDEPALAELAIGGIGGVAIDGSTLTGGSFAGGRLSSETSLGASGRLVGPMLKGTI
ncbi:MAG: hypothetical protein WD971_01100 [Pirellulales bacterium]